MNKNKSIKGQNRETLSEKSRTAIVEAYGKARKNIIFMLSAESKKSFAVTGYSRGEGKSTSAANLAISFSKGGKKVLLIDSDFREPNIHNVFKIGVSPGLSEILGRMAKAEDCICRGIIKNLDVLPAGTLPPNPSELLSSKVLSELTDAVENEYDYIIFDTPPVGVVSDALLLKEAVAGFVVVVCENLTLHGELRRLIESVNDSGSKVLGIIEEGCRAGASQPRVKTVIK